MSVPKLDARSITDLETAATELAKLYVPAWTGVADETDPGRVVLDLFARLLELLIERENRIPEKNFLQFLDLVGVEQAPGSPAQVAVTFLLAKGAERGAIVPERTRVATTQTEAGAAQTFETTRPFFATPAQVTDVIILAPGAETYAKLELPSELPPSADWLERSDRSLSALDESAAALDPIPHVLYLESAALFGREEAVHVTLNFELAAGDASPLSSANLSWKRYNADLEQWDPVTATSSTVGPLVTVELQDLVGAGEAEVAGHEGFWLAGHLAASALGTSLPSISRVTGQLAPAGTHTLSPEISFANSLPLDFSKPVRPFGERASYGDAFFLGSTTALGPEVSSIELRYTVLERTIAEFVTQFDGIVDPVTFDTDVEWEYSLSDGTWRSIAEFRHRLEVTATTTLPSVVPTPSKLSGPSGIEQEGSGAIFPAAGNDQVVLVLPIGPDIGLQKIGGEEAYWIRAILRSTEPYGSDVIVIPGAPEDTANNIPATPPVFVGPLHYTPTIEKLEITYTHRPDAIAPDRVLAENNFAHDDHTSGNDDPTETFQPFVALTDHVADGVSGVFAAEPAVYVGLDRALENVTVSLLVHLEQAGSQTTSAIESGDPGLTYEYFATDGTWRPLDVLDGTYELTTSGALEFLAPADAGSLTLFPLLVESDEAASDEARFWLRARLTSGGYDHPPQVRGVYLNTVLVENRVTQTANTIVGSGNGRRDQEVELVRTPILGGELWVREPERPSEHELEALHGEVLDALRLADAAATHDLEALVDVREVDGSEPETWVRWHQVANFASSGGRSRHYTLDRVHGLLGFGDGSDGLIPPLAKDNLVLRELEVGGGEAARRAATPLAVQVLETSLPFISKLFNVEQATGGSDPWTLEDTERFGPQIIKNRGRAITTEDYEWMVLEQFGQIDRARCLPTQAPGANQTLGHQPGAVTVLVVPKSDAALAQPSSGLRRQIQDYLEQRALGCIVSDVHVIGPTYTPVSIQATVKATTSREASLVARRVTAALEQWLHPQTGGALGSGWDFGRDVSLPEVFALIAGIAGVDYVQSAAFLSGDGAVSENALAASGSHEIGVI